MDRQLGTRPPPAPPSSNPATMCRFHARGTCRAGDDCLFVHEKVESAPRVRGDSLPPPGPFMRSLTAQATPPPCRFFLRGQCNKGENCAFSHAQAAPPPPPSETAAEATPPVDARVKIPCSFFAKGACRNGDGCPFLHNTVDTQNNSIIPDDTLILAMEKCTRDLLGASISFGPGASVDKISLSSDYSTARITNLPAGSGPGYVSLVLNRLGLEVPPSCVRVRPYGQDNPTIAADVRVEDPTFAKSLHAKYEAGELAKVHGLSDVKVFALAAPAFNGAGGFAHRVNCRKVICSWHKPLRVALLNFDSEEVAKEVCDGFSTGAYKVLGSAVSCRLGQAEGPYRNSRGYQRRFPSVSRTWTLTLRVPLQATDKDILRTIPRHTRPTDVGFEGTTYRLGDECSARQLAMIEKLLTNIGALEMKLTANSEIPGKRVKAMARFVDEADAKEAVGILNNTRLPFNEADKLNVCLVYSSTYKVATKVFEAVLGDVEAAKAASSEQHVHVKHFPPANGYITLRLEGEDRGDLAAAEKVVDAILRGQTVTDKEGTTPFWHPSFGNRAAAGQALQRIEQSFQVAFHCLPSKTEVRVYGTPDRVAKARDALLRAFGDSPSTSYSIPLDAESFRWAIRGGFRDLRDALGPENVMLSVLPTVRKIEVIGPRASYDLAMDMMVSGRESTTTTTTTNASAQKQRTEKSPGGRGIIDCSVCWTEAEDPLTTRCGHVYCRDCFENFCRSADSGGDGGSDLRCLADEGSCDAVLGLPELHEHLPSLAFEEVLASSAKSYIAKRPGVFRYCPTADCGLVYRAAAADRPGVFACPGCAESVCTACHHPSHAGRSCAELRYAASGGEAAFDRAKAGLGIKDCPRCETSIQKASGCNHMTCGRCGAHICWVCLDTFASGRACYSHLNKEHGSIFPDDDPLYE
ncbi:ATP-dependent RNA helicase DEAH12, chloroplastic [Colletotrichum tanaceti]|uniref:ATP-dependent RNA helicase DEAH12, chloroplastic n=1 Tax=Colletotrichum tanaceti TaxID=1306861 RepID=A0A4U6X3S1_9PEZI|nr:ATP-dependent RNA helicase DEAH12, chloroplastic [Colletotrichum tanaceti]TKW49419.1 ATP-dependent RNA helicase DEAH12, chloroplastic [Colletotrichum tanaceti]